MSTTGPSRPGMNGPGFQQDAKDANPYFALTDEFNQDRIRTILTSGQACVYYRLAFQSKDGDWLMNLDQGDMDHVLSVLSSHGARFRVGSVPLSVKWHDGGWSSHLEFSRGSERLRTDFVGRPPRIADKRLMAMWREIHRAAAPVTDILDLIQIKKTQREKDWPIIGSLSARLQDPKDVLLHSTSPTRLLAFAADHPELLEELARQRPLLLATTSGSADAVRREIMTERMAAMDADRHRMRIYAHAMRDWQQAWKAFAPTVTAMPTLEANQFLEEQAHGILPTHPQ